MNVGDYIFLKPYLSVVIPAYNEERRLNVTLGSMWRALRRRFADFEMIVINDGSIDGTATVVEDFSKKHFGVRLISYSPNRGKGYAVRQGILASRGQYVLFCDADQSTPIREVSKLLQAVECCDIAIGSRAIQESRIVQRQPFYREMMGKIFNKFVRLLAVPEIRDTQCGFKCFKGEVARELFRMSKINGFAFDVEILYLARKHKKKISEVGVFWRNDNDSRVHPVQHSIKMLYELVMVRVHHV